MLQPSINHSVVYFFGCKSISDGGCLVLLLAKTQSTERWLVWRSVTSRSTKGTIFTQKLLTFELNWLRLVTNGSWLSKISLSSRCTARQIGLYWIVKVWSILALLSHGHCHDLRHDYCPPSCWNINRCWLTCISTANWRKRERNVDVLPETVVHNHTVCET